MNKKTKILTLLTMVVLLAFAIPVTGSAASPKAQVKKSVTAFLKYAKNQNMAKMAKCFADEQENTAMYPDTAVFQKGLRPYARRLQWQVKSCKVKGSRAVVKVRLNYADLHASYSNVLKKAVEYITTDFDASVNSTIRNMTKWMKQEIAKNGAETKTCENVKIRLKKIDGKWKILEPGEELADAVTCGLVQGFYEWYTMEMITK